MLEKITSRLETELMFEKDDKPMSLPAKELRMLVYASQLLVGIFEEAEKGNIEGIDVPVLTEVESLINGTYPRADYIDLWP